MSEFSDFDFKNWFAWSLMGGKTVWVVICDQFPSDPEKCFRAWNQFKYWAYQVTAHDGLAPPAKEMRAS